MSTLDNYLGTLLRCVLHQIIGTNGTGAHRDREAAATVELSGE